MLSAVTRGLRQAFNARAPSLIAMLQKLRLQCLPLFFGWILLAGLVISPGPLPAQEHSVKPDINTQYENPDYQEWATVFERPGREVYDQRERIVAATGLKPGMAVADIGAGTGLFTRLFAGEVGPSGRVYAVDVAKPFIDNILRTAREQGLDNVEGIVNTQTDTRLPPESIDLAFVCDTYHHFEYPQKMLQSIHRALRPQGTLVVIDFRKDPPAAPWIRDHVRAGQETVIQEIQAAGFRLIEAPELLRTNYFLRFRKP